jgi:DNA-directed RNA polymerase subunit RPC12/RpoP
MAAPVQQSGVIVACPRCGAEVMQKEMIPVGVLDGVISYLCVACSRTELRTAPR